MPSKRPPKADRMIVANHLRADATMMRSQAETNRTLPVAPEVAEAFRKFSAQQEARAARFERVANWMVDL